MFVPCQSCCFLLLFPSVFSYLFFTHYNLLSILSMCIIYKTTCSKTIIHELCCIVIFLVHTVIQMQKIKETQRSVPCTDRSSSGTNILYSVAGKCKRVLSASLFQQHLERFSFHPMSATDREKGEGDYWTALSMMYTPTQVLLLTLSLLSENIDMNIWQILLQKENNTYLILFLSSNYEFWFLFFSFQKCSIAF